MSSRLVPRTLRLSPSLAVLLALPWVLAPQPAGTLNATPMPPVMPADLAADGAAHSDDGSTALARDRHLVRLGVDRWHAAGHRGRGVKVAILDSGFHGYRDQLGKALPKHVTVRSFRHDNNLEAKDSQHGVLCGEVVHALAPEAELLFANWEPGSPEKFLEAVRWARKEGAAVLSCSIIMPTWSDGEGRGPVHDELAGALGTGSKAGDGLFFACAGNTADRHWCGPFDDGGDGRHLWERGETDNALYPWGSGRVSVELVAEQDADLELIVHELSGDTEIQRTRLRSGGVGRSAVVRFDPEAGKRYVARVKAAGTQKGRFRLYVLGGGLSISRSGGSIPFPGDGPEVVTVGAVHADRSRAWYSSCGPNSKSPKPDVMGVVPFVSAFREKPFSGTSAATPQAAALAALMWGRHRDWSAEQVRQAVTSAAEDLGPKGHDWETGHGQVRLPPLGEK